MKSKSWLAFLWRGRRVFLPRMKKSFTIKTQSNPFGIGSPAVSTFHEIFWESKGRKKKNNFEGNKGIKTSHGSVQLQAHANKTRLTDFPLRVWQTCSQGAAEIRLLNIHLPTIHLPTIRLPIIYLPTIYLPTIYIPTNYSPTNYSSTNYSPTDYSPIDYSLTDYSAINYLPSEYSPTDYSAINYSPSNYSPTDN
jgi:hypothetical protein